MLYDTVRYTSEPMGLCIFWGIAVTAFNLITEVGSYVGYVAFQSRKEPHLKGTVPQRRAMMEVLYLFLAKLWRYCIFIWPNYQYRQYL